MSTTEIEKRLIAIEQELADLKVQQGLGTSGVKAHLVRTLENIHGVFEKDNAFQQAMRLGRQWLESQRPKKRRSENNDK